MSVVHSNDIEDCSCTDWPKTFKGFERKEFNKEVKRLNDEIIRLRKLLEINN
jgi:hypothetical protein